MTVSTGQGEACRRLERTNLGDDLLVLGDLLLLGLGLSLLERSKVSSSLESHGGDESLDGRAVGDQHEGGQPKGKGRFGSGFD
jgi:hypothetical protein